MLYTIGHGATPISDLLQRLERHGVRMLLDVRTHPYSRRAPHFSRHELEAELTAAGIAYRWVGDHLGGKPLTEGTDAPIENPSVLSAGITEGAGLARGATSALLCAELEPARCHRARVLADRFEAVGFEVAHILADGSTDRHQPALDI